MTATTASGSSTTDTGAVRRIDPRGPRFGQTTTMSVLLVGIALQEPFLILAIALLLNVAVLSGWRINLYGLFWRNVAIRVIAKPTETEPSAPHRFAMLMGTFMSTTATVLLFGAMVVELPLLAWFGYGLALVHAGMAAIGGIGDYCLGCRMYKQVGYVRRLGLV